MGMTAFDYVLPALLILSVVRQLRGKRLTLAQLSWPLGLVLWAAAKYVRGFPPTSGDVLLVGGCAAVGTLLGAIAARFTDIARAQDGTVVARATPATVVLWSAGAVGRLLFGLYAEHGGGPAVARFSAEHGLAVNAWATALTIMSLAEVLGRTLVLAPTLIAARRGARTAS